MSEENLPPERDVKDYKFQQLCKAQVRAPVQTDDIKGFYSLIDTSSKYGLTFVGIQNGFKVIRTQEFIEQDSKHTSDRLQYVITDIPLVCVVDVGHQVTHVAISCDGLTLAVGVSVTDRCQLNMYDVRAFAQPVTGSVSPFLIVNLGNDELIDLAWNPSGHTYLVTCQASGRLDLFSITASLEMKANLPTAKAKCVCWSPKGKQLVVGTSEGRLVQYDFELKEKRKWDYPTSIFEDQSYSVMSIVWLSTYTFLAGYLSIKAESSDQPNLVLVNGSKDGPTTYENLEDICFGTGESRLKKYFFNFIQQWDMVITGSSCASEIAIMAKHLDQKQIWERWNLDDAARAECPLTEDYTDTYPLGMAVDLSSQTVISLGDERTHPSSPLMLILTTAGYVIPYHCMYMHKDAPQITAAPEVLNKKGCRQPVGVQTNTPAAPQPSGGSTSAVKNLFGTSTSQSKPLFGSGSQPVAAQNTHTPFTFGSQPDSKPLFAGLGQTENQTPFGAKLTTPATQSGQTAESKPGLFSGSTGSSTFNFSAAAAGTSSSTKVFGFAALSNQQTSSPAPTATTAQGFAGFGSVTSSSVSSAPSAGFGSFALSMTATTTSTATGAPTFSFGAGLGQTASPFQVKPTASVASDAVGTKFNTSSITAPNSFSFATKTAGQPAGFGLASPAGLVTGSKPNLPSTQAPQAQPGSSNLFGKPVPGTTSGAQTSQIGLNQGQAASFAPPSGPVTAVPAKEKSGLLPTQPPVPSSTPSHLHKSTTLTSLTQIAEPEPAAPAKFRPRSPEHAPPPAYPTNQSLTAAATNEAARPSEDENNQLGDTVDRSFAKSIQEEILHFEKELRDLKARAGKTECEIGSREDMIRLRTKTEEMGKFCEDIKKTVQEQNKDVQDQTSLCLDMFAMVEECRVRQQLNSDPKYKSLLKSRALDSASAEKLQDLQLQNQALDQGLRDVDMILDSQWEEYQNRKKSQSRRVQAPTNDAIYRVVKSNHNLILAQKSRVKEMEERLKQLKLYNKTSTWNNTGLSQYNAGDTSTMLSSLADSLVESRPVTSSSRVSSDGSSTRSNKLAQLRDHLYHRHVPVVRSTKPENLSMSRLTIPDTSLMRSPQKPQPTVIQTQKTLTGLDGSQASGPPTLGSGQGQMKTAGPSDKPQTVKPNKQAVPQKPAPSFTGSKTATSTANSGKSSFVFSQPAGGTGTAGQFQFTASQNSGQTITGFGLGSETSTMGMAVPQVREINGIKFEDITPSGSENEIETTEEEDEEYDEEEEDEESSGESYGAGFGLQYSMPGQGSQITSTPVATKPPTDNVPTPKAQTSNTPVARKLFGQDETKPAGTFQFGASKSQDSGFKFGAEAAAGKPAKTVFDTSQTENKSAGQNKQPENAAGNQGGETSTAAGFNLGKSTGSGFNFGTSDPKTTTGITGLFGSKTASSSGSTSTSTGLDVSAAAGFMVSSSVSTSGPTTSGSSGVAGLNLASATVGPTFVGFGAANTSTSQTGDKPSFGSSGLFGSTPVVQPSSNADSSQDKSGLATSTSTGGGLFGKGAATSSASTSVFGQPSTDTSSNLGALLSASDCPPDSTTKPTDSSQSSATSQSGTFSFGQPSTTTQASTIFGQSGSSTQSSSFSFGQSTSTTQSSTPLFGQTSANGSSTSGLFGKPTTTPSSVASTLGQTASSSSGVMFGQTPSSSSGGLFGQTTTSSSGGLFGQTTTSSSGGLFGQSATSASGGLFGQSATNSTGGLFGQTATTSSGGLFGQTTTSSSGGLFGQTPTSSTGLFGSQTTSGGGLFGKSDSSGSPFGQSQTSSSGGMFGSSTTTTASGIFATPSTSGTSLFGSSVASSSTGLFGTSSSTSNSSPFGMSTTTNSGPFGTSVTSSGSGVFGSASSSAGSFSFGKPGFGQSPSFGQTASPGSGFGGSGGLFGQSNESSSGGLFAGLGGKPSEEKANTNVFGGGTFGSQTQTSSSGLFGSSSPSTFGSSTSTGSGGLFSGGGAGVGSTGFGSSQQPAGSGFGSSGFGAAPAFGGSPAFGSPPKFGSSPAFGGGGFGAQPTFGAASPMGGGGGGATFGSASANSGGGFAGFASAGSPTFGALAQSTDAPTFGSLNSGGNPGFGSPPFGGGQQNQPGFGGGSFGSSPQFTGYRG